MPDPTGAERARRYRERQAGLAKVEANNSAGFSFTLAGVGTSRDGYHWLTELHDPDA